MMKKRKSLSLFSILPVALICFSAMASDAQSKTATPQTVDSTFDLYLLIGQSNMAGRGEVTDAYRTEGSDAVLMLNKDGQWVRAAHPLHFDKPAVAGVGPGLRFGLEMAGATHHKIGLVPGAVGGTSIDAWKPGGYDKATATHPYDEATARLKAAMLSGKLKGVLWLQGESDSDTAKAKHYRQKLVELINRIRRLVGDPLLPFAAGELGRFKEQYANVNNQLATLPETVAHTAVASSEGLKDKGDATHYDSASAEEMGSRFAKQMMRLQKQ